MNLKWITIPSGNKRIEAASLWEVRWSGRTGIYSHDTIPCVEVFPEENDAREFAARLVDSFKLLHISGESTTVKVKRAK